MAVVPEMATETPKDPMPGVRGGFSSATCFQTAPVFVKTSAAARSVPTSTPTTAVVPDMATELAVEPLGSLSL